LIATSLKTSSLNSFLKTSKAVRIERGGRSRGLKARSIERSEVEI
jgi:hypothetical protein